MSEIVDDLVKAACSLGERDVNSYLEMVSAEEFCAAVTELYKENQQLKDQLKAIQQQTKAVVSCVMCCETVAEQDMPEVRCPKCEQDYQDKLAETQYSMYQKHFLG